MMAKAQILARSADKDVAIKAYEEAVNLPKTTSGSSLAKQLSCILSCACCYVFPVSARPVICASYQWGCIDCSVNLECNITSVWDVRCPMSAGTVAVAWMAVSSSIPTSLLHNPFVCFL